jgi:Tol biopolymer transport system component/DNA-binding winged helix-turn-helix (wHTH) protein
VSSPDLPESTTRFGEFSADLETGELRRNGAKVKLQGQPFEILALLLKRPGRVVTREELRQRLWPSDTFVDFEHGLNAAVNRLREALGDSADEPRFIETVPRRGYRFIAAIEGHLRAEPSEVSQVQDVRSRSQSLWLRIVALIVGVVCLGSASLFIYKRTSTSRPSVQRTLTRLTFDEGLQVEATWSPDGRLIAYSSDRAGKFDIWVQQVSGGNPVQVTKGPAHNWQPDWSPDGKYIVYRSEEGDGGLYIVPALGGAGMERKIASFGYYPRWSPDGSKILFGSFSTRLPVRSRFYVVESDGSAAREVWTDLAESVHAYSAAWLPDSQRICIWAPGEPAPNFWAIPVGGGPASRLEIAPEVVKHLTEAAGQGGGIDISRRFSWSPSGTAIYWEHAYQDARNIWRLTIDPRTLRGTGIERLTTGSGADIQPALSADGKRLAFTTQTQQVRTWLFPLDATRGRITGPGQAVTSSAVQAWTPNLSRDGGRLAFFAERGGKFELREELLSEGREIPIAAADDSYGRTVPQWSRDGTSLAYVRQKTFTTEVRSRAEIFEDGLMLWSSQNRTEEPITDLGQTNRIVYDWSPDDKLLLFSQSNSNTGRYEIWQLPVAARPHAEAAAQKIISNPDYDLFQPHFSPDGRWIVFEAISNGSTPGSALYIIPAVGGSWIRITDGKSWDDKPRWSPDGKMIYFVSGRGGLFNVWGIRFDPVKGKPFGEPFRVTAFERPALMIPQRIPWVEISLTQHRLALNLVQMTGNIWMLDNVDR